MPLSSWVELALAWVESDPGLEVAVSEALVSVAPFSAAYALGVPPGEVRAEAVLASEVAVLEAVALEVLVSEAVVSGVVASGVVVSEAVVSDV